MTAQDVTRAAQELEGIANEIEAIAEGFKKLANTRLKQDTIVLLLSRSSREIKIRGAVPNKKDSLRPRDSYFRRDKRKGMVYDEAVMDGISSVVIQVRHAWRNRKPLEHPRISVQFTFPHKRRDRDGRLATILDALKVAGVVADDNVAHCNGEITILPAIVDRTIEEGAIVRIWG